MYCFSTEEDNNHKKVENELFLGCCEVFVSRFGVKIT